MVFVVLGNGFDRRGGGGGGGFGIYWSVVVAVVLGSGFDCGSGGDVLGSGLDYRFMGLLEIGLFTGFVGLIC